MRRHHRKNSTLLCGMFAAGPSDLSGTRQEPLHRPVTFEYGLRGVEVEGNAACSQDLVSTNCHRVE